ncbi:MAG: response regulator, partial [Bryobacteraceae bacterium]|nr:response regulator [Bryobacteraceae bacterium]
TLKLMAGYASDSRQGVATQFRIGQGLVGQCAQEKRRMLINQVPQDYIRISSSLGESTPVSIVVLPVLFEGEAKAVIELASFQRFSDIHLSFLDQITQSLGIVLNTIAATMRTEELLKQSQALTEQLQKINAELEEKAQLLAEQKTEVETKNREVEQAKAALEEKAEQLALTSKYKSEFLANMSHELRTPLNNLLILAQMLAENAEKNLIAKQVRFAETIHSSGTDLLALINDILDLSKIESGKMDVEIGSVRFADLRDYCSRTFRHVADGKSLEFHIDLDPNLPPETIHTDAKRLQQVLKNLLSNALKFTERGSVKLHIKSAVGGWSQNHPLLNRSKSVIAFSVTDTGIGIPQDKQRIIFEAFQQADGTTSRKYGGTGLGLSISRELARLLGGEIRLQSAPGVGSTFTLYLPQVYMAMTQGVKSDFGRSTINPPALTALTGQVTGNGSELPNGTEAALDFILPPPASTPATLVEDLAIDDDRNIIQPGDPVLLIIEDDVTFARILVDLAHDKHLKVVVALRGHTALALAREFLPVAITLDINLPDMAGWTILDRLKHDPATRHVPVHIISGDEDRRRGFALGAMTYISKSTTRKSLIKAFSRIEQSVAPRVKRLLLATEDETRRVNLHQVVGAPDLEVVDVKTGGELVAAIRQDYFDAVVIDLRLGDLPALRVIEELQSVLADNAVPVIFYSKRNPTEEESAGIHKLAVDGIVRHVRSPEQLLYETVLLLHRAEANLGEHQRKILADLARADEELAGRKVLVIDDDLRNIFALTSVLEQHNLNVLHAENGRAGIELLKNHPDVDAILMDIMMPVMVGYETTRAVRQIPEFRSIPIVALTAKA